jgi:hypothetical protein
VIQPANRRSPGEPAPLPRRSRLPSSYPGGAATSAAAGRCPAALQTVFLLPRACCTHGRCLPHICTTAPEWAVNVIVMCVPARGPARPAGARHRLGWPGGQHALHCPRRPSCPDPLVLVITLRMLAARITTWISSIMATMQSMTPQHQPSAVSPAWVGAWGAAGRRQTSPRGCLMGGGAQVTGHAVSKSFCSFLHLVRLLLRRRGPGSGGGVGGSTTADRQWGHTRAHASARAASCMARL